MVALSAGRASRRLALTSALLVAGACGRKSDRAAPQGPPPSGAVSAATPEATAAGIRVLAAGGNAMDAALAAALVLGVTEPSQSGLGGHAVVLVVPPGQDGVVVHAGPGQPLAGPPGQPPLTPPTGLAVLGRAWQRFGSGTLSWEELVEPAIRAAEDGWPLGAYRHRIVVQQYAMLVADSLTARLLLNPDLSIPTEGTRVTNPALANTLKKIADDGPGAFGHTGLRTALAAAIQGHGYGGAAGWLQGAPQAEESAPARGSYHGRTILTTPAPYGGPMLLRALRFLEAAPENVLRDPGLGRTAWLAEAIGWARSDAPDVATWLKGQPPLPLPPGDTVAPTPRGGGPPPPRGGSGGGDETTHLSVVDGTGMAVSVTLSLGKAFGAGFVLGDLGFFPGVGDSASAAPADSTGASGGEGGVRWWAAPTVELSDGATDLVLGSPGGPRGVAAVAQVLAEWVAGAGTLRDVVQSPRVLLEPDTTADRGRLFLEGVIWLDSARSAPRILAPFGDSLVRPMASKRGFILGVHDEGPLLQSWDPWFGGVNAVARADSGWVAAADPRRDGDARVVGAEDVAAVRGRGSVAPPPPEKSEGGGAPGLPLPDTGG